MSDVNATPAEPVTVPAVEPAVEPVAETPVTVVAAPEVAVAPVEEPVAATSAASPSLPAHESLLARIEGLPADAVHVLHDVLDHVREGVEDMAMTIGFGRLKSLFEKTKSRL